jgi:plastocyanin
VARPIAVALVLAGLAALVGCGGSTGSVGPPSVGPTSTPPPAPQTVEIRNFAYSPRDITVPVGTTVVWVQEDSTVHTVTDAGVFDSGHLSRGQRYSHTFRIPGTYDYRGTVHRGMFGSVTVQ